MKRFIAVFLIIVLSVCLFSACRKPEEPINDPENQDQPVVKDYGRIFYVAVDGSDTNEGTKESPLATPGGAVAKVREYKKANGLPEGGIKVEFAAGNYRISSTVSFSSEDSGEEGKPIVYAAADGAEVSFNGGIAIAPSEFMPVTDKDVLSLLKNGAAVLVADLSDGKYSDLFSDGSSQYLQELSVNGATKTQARYPNGDDIVAEIISADGDYSCFAITEEQAEAWSRYDTLCWHGYGTYEWSDSVSVKAFVDADAAVLKVPDTDITYAPAKDGLPFFVFNLLCELDEPGEYYFDADARKLYYWPESALENDAVYLSAANTDGAIIFDNASHIVFSGLIFENHINMVISGTVSDFTLEDSVIRCCSGNPDYKNAYAVNIRGINNTINGCDFHDLYRGAVCISGNDTVAMIPSGNSITNTLFYHIGRFRSVNSDAIKTNGCGFYIAHNKIYDTPAECITIESAQTVVEYNEIYDTVKKSSDAGAIYAGRHLDWKEIVIRYNYIHDIRDYLFTDMPQPHAVYFDDALTFGKCYDNIFVNIEGDAIACGGGRNLSIFNNVFVNTGRIAIDERGANWYPTVTSYSDGALWTFNVANNYLSDL